MNINTKNAILNNEFLSKMHINGVVDESEYQVLIHHLRLLSVELRNSASIDKELAQELYSLLTITRNEAEAQQKRNPILANRLKEIWIELDNLVIDCLAV